VVGVNNRDVRIVEVPATVDSLNGGDVFVLDTGKAIYQWNGHKSGVFEKVADTFQKKKEKRKYL
jgi:gelsolin